MHLGEELQRRGLLTGEQLAQSRELMGQGLRLDEAIVRLGYLTEEAVLGVLAEVLGLDRVSLGDRTIDRAVLDLVPSRLVFKHQVLPIARENGTLILATRNPFDVYTLDDIHARTGLHVETVLASGEEIAQAIRNHFGVGGETVGELLSGPRSLSMAEIPGAGEEADELAEEASVVRLVNEILREAIEHRASDVHLEPTERGLRIRCRIDGVLQIQALPPEIHRFAPAIVSRIKIMARLNIAEKRLPQDGRIQIRFRDRQVDLRVSIIPMTFGEGVVLRILDRHGMSFDLAGLGMHQDQYARWRRLIGLPHGILLVTGPTGSGKTTTLYSALQEIARDEIKIITIEDPVEYHFDRIQQIQVHPRIGLTFAAGLRSILRHDPDVVLVGEIRDLETAEIATQAALTGHLVLSTLHTNDAPSSFPRLTDMGVEPFLVSSTVEAVMAQRLVRKICDECREEYTPDPAQLPSDFPADMPRLLARGRGCRACRNTGYRGRVGIFELLEATAPIRELVIERSGSDVLRTQAIRDGLVSLRWDAWNKLRAGVTTLDEVLRVTKPDETDVQRAAGVSLPWPGGLIQGGHGVPSQEPC